MEIYVVLAVCAIIALCTSERANVVAVLGVNRFFAIFVLLSILCLSRFEIDIVPELRLNPGLLVLPLAVTRFRSNSGKWLNMWSCVLIFAVLSFLAERLGWLYGAENGLLCGMLAGAAIILLDENQYTAFLGISIVPLMKTMLDMFYSQYSMGYSALDFSSSALLNAQILAVTMAAFLVFIRKSKGETAKN